MHAIEEEHVKHLVELLRLANANIVFKAFCEAPTDNLLEMEAMITYILENRHIN